MTCHACFGWSLRWRYALTESSKSLEPGTFRLILQWLVCAVPTITLEQWVCTACHLHSLDFGNLALTAFHPCPDLLAQVDLLAGHYFGRLGVLLHVPEALAGRCAVLKMGVIAPTLYRDWRQRVRACLLACLCLIMWGPRVMCGAESVRWKASARQPWCS